MADRLSPAPPPPPRAGAGAGEERYAAAGLLIILLATTGWWALAFWPAPDAPAWLERTRYVCFGVRGGSGLPDAGGWINLVGQPLGMLAVLWVGWRRGVRALAARMRRSVRLRAAALVVALPFAAAALLAGLRVLAAGDVVASEVDAGDGSAPARAAVRLDRPAPPLALIDQHGAERTLEEFRGRPVLVTFAFGHCETVCPLLVRDVLAAQALLRAEAGSPVPAALIVTLDPWRDTPARLPFIARAWRLGPDAAILGGDAARVTATLDAWGVARERDPRTGDVVHPALVYVVDDAGRLAFAAPGGAETLAELVRRAAGGEAG